MTEKVCPTCGHCPTCGRKDIFLDYLQDTTKRLWGIPIILDPPTPDGNVWRITNTTDRNT